MSHLILSLFIDVMISYIVTSLYKLTLLDVSKFVIIF